VGVEKKGLKLAVRKAGDKPRFTADKSGTTRGGPGKINSQGGFASG